MIKIIKHLVFHQFFSMLSFFYTGLLEKPTKNQIISPIWKGGTEDSQTKKAVRSLLSKSFESNVVSIEIGEHCVVHIRNVVLHTVISQKHKQNKHIYQNIGEKKIIMLQIRAEESAKGSRVTKTYLICSLMAASHSSEYLWRAREA